MNRLLHFTTGALTTFTFSNSLTSPGLGHFIVTQIVSLAGGLLSAVLIAWLQDRWHSNKPDSFQG